MKKFHPKCTQCKCNIRICIRYKQPNEQNGANDANECEDSRCGSCAGAAEVAAAANKPVFRAFFSPLAEYTQLQLMHDFWREVFVCASKCDFIFMYAKRFYFNWYSLLFFLLLLFFYFLFDLFFSSSKYVGSFATLQRSQAKLNASLAGSQMKKITYTQYLRYVRCRKPRINNFSRVNYYRYSSNSAKIVDYGSF